MDMHTRNVLIRIQTRGVIKSIGAKYTHPRLSKLLGGARLKPEIIGGASSAQNALFYILENK